MSDLISRKYLYDKMLEKEELARQRVLDTPTHSPAYLRYVAQLNERTALKHEIADAPTVEPPKGEWMVCDDLFADATVVKCSACGATDFVSNHVLLEVTDVKMHNFCPHCGCDMRKKV